MASSPITSRKIEGEKVEVGMDFLFLGSKITVDGDCSYEIRRWLLLGRKAVRNSVLKSRDITLPTKGHIVKALVFPEVTYCCESWSIKKAERQTIDAFELWCWRRLLKVPWAAKGSNQSILREINPKDSLEGLTLKLKLSILVIWYKQPTHWKSPWCWERLRVEGEEGVRGCDGWMASPMQWTQTGANFWRWWGAGRPGVLQSVGSMSQTQLGDWTTITSRFINTGSIINTGKLVKNTRGQARRLCPEN